MNSKIFIPFIILIFNICFCTCKNESRKNGLTMEALNIETNYFDNDSIQKIDGHYPARVYVIFKVINTYTEPIYIPLRTRNDTIIKSQINIHDSSGIVKSSYSYLYSKNILNPNDSLYFELVIKLNEDDSTQIIKKLSHFVENVQFSYEHNKSDSTISNAIIPSNIIIKKADHFNMKYRNKETLHEDIDWVL